MAWARQRIPEYPARVPESDLSSILFTFGDSTTVPTTPFGGQYAAARDPLTMRRYLHHSGADDIVKV